MQPTQGQIWGEGVGVHTPPPPLRWYAAFRIWLPYQSVTPFLSSAPPLKENPATHLFGTPIFVFHFSIACPDVYVSLCLSEFFCFNQHYMEFKEEAERKIRGLEENLACSFGCLENT